MDLCVCVEAGREGGRGGEPRERNNRERKSVVGGVNTIVSSVARWVPNDMIRCCVDRDCAYRHQIFFSYNQHHEHHAHAHVD